MIFSVWGEVRCKEYTNDVLIFRCPLYFLPTSAQSFDCVGFFNLPFSFLSSPRFNIMLDNRCDYRLAFCYSLILQYFDNRLHFC